MTKPTPNLAKLIATDLITVGRWSLLLLLLIMTSAMGVVFATHHARQAITEKDHTLVERERLDSEWRNLMLEETALAEHSRVQDLAKKDLEMKRPDGDKEVVITLK
ncbi:cell division protein FtsL [Vibrio parahaemolyticus]|uniref:cell division protein FtsL n=1 Tax=Vibrio parahaemolyticus TaxID=670 RepID=UPI0006A5B207|nr:cell division protein FtsL [Vibrio parahaemolyticus]EGQ8944278.1 cell division protein FtsL [Vibrio parahaemolyticus]EGR3005434.1 cell division protein FtsL [Vibrio parahaemolyticus]EGR3142134.1 cell division protein FtsL [Vibrio parahaemolyticus]EGR3180620.1 cell division protein FtsL [Vibrio parahaemolyticus]EGR3195340.1 cell division protein FtsL [Vibrio parahaemolyticus]